MTCASGEDVLPGSTPADPIWLTNGGGSCQAALRLSDGRLQAQNRSQDAGVSAMQQPWQRSLAGLKATEG